MLFVTPSSAGEIPRQSWQCWVIAVSIVGKCTGRVKGRAGCESHPSFPSQSQPTACYSRVMQPKTEMFALGSFYLLSLVFFHSHTKVLHTNRVMAWWLSLLAATIQVFMKILHQTLQSSIKAESSFFRNPYKVVCLPTKNIKLSSWHWSNPITVIMCSNRKKSVFTS